MAKTEQKPPIIPYDTGKWIDVNREAVSDATKGFLSRGFIDYAGSSNDLIAVVRCNQYIQNHAKDIDEEIQAEIKSLADLASQHDAAYVRFIQH